MIRITVLNDNRCFKNGFKYEHGLSLFIQADEKRILFDAGQSDIFINNAEELLIDLTKTDIIVLSHGDYDHGNGLKYLETDTCIDLVCHPDFLNNRISKRTGKYGGLNQTREELKEKYNLIETKEPYNISDNIVFLGEIPRENDFEKGKNLPMIDENGNTYKHLDDSGLVIKTEQGIIVISGCAHSGICNTIEYAKTITKDNRVLAAIGGFHLKDLDEQTKKTIQYMKDNKVQSIYLAHCTDEIVCNEFKKELPEQTKIVGTGEIYRF